MRLLWDQLLMLGAVKSRKHGCSVEVNIIVWNERQVKVRNALCYYYDQAHNNYDQDIWEYKEPKNITFKICVFIGRYIIFKGRSRKRKRS